MSFEILYKILNPCTAKYACYKFDELRYLSYDIFILSEMGPRALIQYTDAVLPV